MIFDKRKTALAIAIAIPLAASPLSVAATSTSSVDATRHIEGEAIMVAAYGYSPEGKFFVPEYSKHSPVVAFDGVYSPWIGSQKFAHKMKIAA